MKTHIECCHNKIASDYDKGSKLVEYVKLLLEENQRVNLVSRETTPETARLMAVESLLPLDYLERAINSYLDIGSGGGLPAVPLLLTGRISGRAILMEKIGKKSAATARIIESLGLDAEAISENFPSGLVKPAFDLITLKWVKLDLPLLSRIVKHLSPRGCFIHYSSEPLSSDFITSTTYTYEDSQTGVIKGFTVYQKI